MLFSWIILGLLIIAVIWVISVFNALVSLKNQTLNGWRQIDVQLKRRYDLIPNLIETVKGAMGYEQKTLTMVVEARNKALSAQGPVEKSIQENILTGALKQLFALVENYPVLKANENVIKLQQELSVTENQISFARQFYNDIATKFNIAQQVFPSNVIAAMFGFKQADLFGVTEAKEKEAPKVDLGIK